MVMRKRYLVGFLLLVMTVRTEAIVYHAISGSEYEDQSFEHATGGLLIAFHNVWAG